MINWLFLSIFAYVLFAFSSITDRYLLAGSLPHPRAYAFYTGITGIFAVVLIPWGFEFLSPAMTVFSLFAGVVSVLALYASYRAVFYSGVSRIVPMVGALFPVFTFLLFSLFARESVSISQNELIAFILFIIGTVFLSLEGSLKRFRPSWFDIRNSVLVGFLFALAFVLAKEVYDAEGFVNGLIWTRWGGFLTALSFLAFPATRKVVFRGRKNPATQHRVFIPFLLGKGTGAVAFLAQQYAISIARNFQLTMISALQGVQYLVLLILVAILSFKNPKLLDEEVKGVNALWRLLGMICIAAGFVVFAL